MDQTLTSKLKIKPEHKVLILNAPEQFGKKLEAADKKASAGNKYDFVVLFTVNTEELNTLWPKVLPALKNHAVLWICYPKKTSSIKTNISRDYGWHVVEEAEFEAVSQIAIDETWSALRFKRRIKNLTPDNKTNRQVFAAVIESPPDIKGGYVSIPFDVEKTFGKKGHTKVKAWFDGYPYRGIIANMGTGCHILIVRKDIQQAIGKTAGDKVKVEIEPDTEERVVEIPQELETMLTRHPKAKKFFDSLSYTNRKEYAQWISTAKKIETREKRLKETIEKLLKGLKNPSQK